MIRFRGQPRYRCRVAAGSGFFTALGRVLSSPRPIRLLAFFSAQAGDQVTVRIEATGQYTYLYCKPQQARRITMLPLRHGAIQNTRSDARDYYVPYSNGKRTPLQLRVDQVRNGPHWEQPNDGRRQQFPTFTLLPLAS